MVGLSIVTIGLLVVSLTHWGREEGFLYLMGAGFALLFSVTYYPSVMQVLLENHPRDERLPPRIPANKVKIPKTIP